MTKKFLISIMILCLLLGGCAKGKSTQKAPTEADSTSNKNVLLTANGEQKIEVVNGSLFFNDYIPSTNDIAYFNPDTA